MRIEALPGGGERSVIQGAVTLDVEGAAAIEDAQVVIECAACEPKVLREAFTNADGLYSVRDLPPGTYDVWVIQTPARYDSERLRVSRQELDTRRSVDLAAGVRARVDFALPLRSAIIVD
ncbi:MAG: carboxypeptidase regulatory-like domain-containing protein [Myxococcales bacterium]|nr:carboxypeptidase regulatory-like domain-containing protein [Myxococcales bacterium]